MGFPKYVINGPISIKGQYIKLHNNAVGHDASTTYNVAIMYGKPVSAIWASDKIQFTTDKGRVFRTDGTSINEFK